MHSNKPGSMSWQPTPLSATGSSLGSPTSRSWRIRKHRCKHAVPLWHYHFFTADGFFGSLNQNLEQVDDGTYTVEGQDLLIGDAAFRYRVQGDQNLRLFPQLSPSDDAGWMVGVSTTANPGIA
jgi:hypothetical protein